MVVKENARKEILQNAKFLKITVQSGGCSGFQYDLEYKNIIEDEILIAHCVLTDDVSQEFLKDVILDFVEEPGVREFIIHNPNKKTCGCGNSFSI